MKGSSMLSSRGLGQPRCGFVSGACRNGSAIGHHQPPPARPRSCAIVSNTGSLRRHRFGAEIDSADLVLRFNTAPTSGYEKYVGRCEGLRLVNNLFPRRCCGDLVHEHRNTPMVSGAKYVVLTEVPFNVPPGFDTMQRTAAPGAVFLASPSAVKAVRDVFRYHEADQGAPWLHEGLSGRGEAPGASAGAFGMLLALSLCDSVLAYGLTKSDDAALSRYHYYGPGEFANASSRNWHPSIDAERQLWRELAGSQHGWEGRVALPGFRCACGAGREPNLVF